MSDQLASVDANTNGTTLTLLRLRDQFGVQDATIVEPSRAGSGAAPDLHIVAQASGNFAALIPDDLPTPLMLSQAREHGAYAAIEGEVDGDPRARREGRAAAARRAAYPRRVDVAAATGGALPAADAAGAADARAQRRRGAARLSRISGKVAGPHRPAQDVHRHADARAVPRDLHRDDARARARPAARAAAVPARAGHEGDHGRRLRRSARSSRATSSASSRSRSTR
jgi:hypothetical protein